MKKHELKILPQYFQSVWSGIKTFGPLWNDEDCSWHTFNDWREGQQKFEITHWMPLPEPPEEVDKNDRR